MYIELGGLEGQKTPELPSHLQIRQKSTIFVTDRETN